MVSTVSKPVRKQRPKTRLDGEGTVFEVNTPYGKRWRAQKLVYKTADGKWVKVSGQGLTPAQAIERREKRILEFQVKTGELPPTALAHTPSEMNLTVEDWLWQWHGSLATEGREQTLAQYAHRIRRHIAPHIGHISLRLLSMADLDAFLVTLRNKRKVVGGVTTEQPLLNSTTIRNIYFILTAAMKEAMRRRLITVNPCDSVKAPARAPRKDEQLDKKLWVPEYLLKSLEGTDDEPLFLLRAQFGLRTSELLGLTDDCLSFGKNPSITIKQQLARMPSKHGCGDQRADGEYPCKKKLNSCPEKQGGYLYIKPNPKTESSKRILPLVEPALSVMKEHIKKQRALRESSKFKPHPGEKMDKLVFTLPDGRARRHQYEAQKLRELFKQHGMEPMRPHAFRHIAITRIVSADVGASYDVVKQIAGHSTIAQSVYYSHQSRNAAEEPLTKYGQMLTSRQERAKNSLAARAARVEEMRRRLAEEEAALQAEIAKAEAEAAPGIVIADLKPAEPAEEPGSTVVAELKPAAPEGKKKRAATKKKAPAAEVATKQ